MRRLVALPTTLSLIVLLWCACALALDPSLNLSQYAHTAWRVRDGFVRGAILVIAQTPDGYLWLGTDAGLYRFDGLRAVPWQPPGGEQLTRNRVQGLLVSRDNTLWIGTLKGLASWKDGKLTQYPELAGQLVGPVVEDRQGTVWVGVYNPGRLCAIRTGKVQCFGADKFGTGVYDLSEDRNGNLWLCSASGLWRWDFSHPDHYTLPGLVINRVVESESGELLLATSDGLKQLVGGAIQNHPLPGITGKFRPTGFFRSHDHSLWVGTTQGVLRSHDGRIDRFGAAEGLSGTFPSCFFEDREGNVWVGTSDGLDRFREYSISRISAAEGLSSSVIYSVQATADGAIWTGSANGLDRWENGHITAYGRHSENANSVAKQPDRGLPDAPHGLGLDDQGRLLASTGAGIFAFEGERFVPIHGTQGGMIWSIAGDGGGKLWINDGTAGLFHITPGHKAEPIPWSRFEQKGINARALLPDRLHGGVWLGFWNGGIVYFKDGQVRTSYTAADGLGAGRVDDLRLGPRGAMWAATESGLSRIKDGHIATLTSKNGLPCDAVHWTMEDADHSMWLYMPCGLMRIARSEMDAWVSDPNHKVQLTMFDESDGIRGLSVYGSIGPHVTKAADGKIWFATGDGVSVIDPSHLVINKIPPPVQIEQIRVDGRVYDPTQGISLPARVQHIDIDYTALSLVAPEKNRFRIKLEGYDDDWRDIGNRRQAFYTNLPPHNYRFRVIASNNSGMWNEAGASMEFSVLPAFYQTNGFRVLCGVGFLAFLWGIYQMRVQQLRQQFNIGLEARVNERTRIARELHDTLLQNFHGLMFQFQAARNLMSRRPEEAMQSLDDAINETKKAIAQSRDAIQGLRSESMAKGNVAELLSSTSRELADSNTNEHSPVFDVIEEGDRKTLSSTVSSDICRIAVELMRNAYQHAHAHRIEAELRYGDSMFRLRIRDDGRGIDPRVLKAGGRTGHWGLRGVRERANRIGASLDLWSEPGDGTEAQLLVPAEIAYEKVPDSYRAKLLRKVKSRA